MRALCSPTSDSRESFDQSLQFCPSEEARNTVVTRRQQAVALKRQDDARQKQAYGRLFEKEVYQEKPVPVAKPQPEPPKPLKGQLKAKQSKQKHTDPEQEEEVEEEDDTGPIKCWGLGSGLAKGMWETFKDTCCCCCKKKQKED